MNKIVRTFSSILAFSLFIGCSQTSSFENISFPGDNTSMNAYSGDAPITPVIPTSPITYNSSTKYPTTNLPFYVLFNNAYKGLFVDNEALGRKDPKNSDKYLFGFIQSAKQTLDIAVYDVDDAEATQALIDAAKRGVRIRLLTDTDNMVDKENPALPRKAIEKLKAAGVEVKDDKRSALMHTKFIIEDSKSVWAGSMNLTTTSMYHHNNNSFIIQSPKIAENYNIHFKRLFEQSDMSGKNPYIIPNPLVDLGNGTTIRTFFSPRGGTMDAVIQELSKARNSIKFMVFSMTHQQVEEVLIAKKKAGVKIEGVFDDCLISNSSLYADLKKNNIYSLRDGNQALLHHKAIIIDDETVITGSFNFSASAEESNNENAFIIKSKTIAGQYSNEYSRVKYSALNNKNLPPYDNPACGYGASSTPAKVTTNSVFARGSEAAD